MKSKNRSFAILAAVTVLVVAYAVFDYQSEKRKDEIQREKSKILASQPEQVSQIEILTSSTSSTTKDSVPVISNKIKLVRTQDGWKLEEPIQESADQSAVSDFIDGLVSESSQETVTEGDQVDWKVFGLNEPRGQISVQNNLGEKTTIYISSKKNYQGDAFLRRNQEAKVLLASSTWFNKLEKRPIDFRDRRILRKSLAQAQGFEVENEHGKFSLVYQDQKWVSPAHHEWKLDQNKIREFLATLSGSLATDYSSDVPASVDDRKKWGLTNPRASLKISFKEGNPWTAHVGRDTDAINRVEASDPAVVVKIEAADAAKFYELQLDFLRDRSEPFAFNRQDVKRIEVHGKSAAVTAFDWKDGHWELTQKAQDEMKADQTRASGLLVRANELTISDFADRKLNLGTVRESLVFKGSDGQVLFELKLGDTQKKKFLGKDQALVMAQTNLFPEVFWMTEADVKSLGLEELLK